MIKINLLREESARATADVHSEPGARNPLYLIGGSAVLSFGVIAFLWWYWSGQIAKLNVQMQRERAEQARLASIQAENARYQKQLQELERRITAIQALEAARVGPVQLMASLGEMVDRTPALYLLSVSNDGERLAFKGQAGTPAAIAEFINVLKNSNSFSDVQLRQYYQDDQESSRSFKFDLDCAYKPVALPTAVGQPEPAGVGAAARAGK
jgi:Tfp pilus assembly protein PilN